ncbi:bifunctional phosphopantothenoylcysteine decarboxylase/phosphopantothenate--cysteine ligase CoaBC [Rhodothermus marinus]|uniref:Coenzyme A biosynthesis bifunctional protein CoaBC n=1 Tax=Rhodothermus marinus (strain ATCC 43812 / DSM 4252 / R-10) TaxID=518766 RepID=D0MK09_RHOM4|nr:bifunctional phosphopantothenoylcysteine decarboxylase/phosphopantothenate--cysteine ligase CoaBC [Rhodothermus marinus]ACY46922.1 phosphopantothenoylcysteine decarboxylase/phosphopantothenate/cysteine ligase [Rhodothermus marinus DSM 4252]
MVPESLASLEGRHLLLGVTGSIAAYKAAELVRLFKKAGAEVQVVMTPDATRFITPLTLGTLSEREVLVDLFPENEPGSWTKHVHLGRWADLAVVAPATAQTLARLAHGFCDTMLAATLLSARCPVLLCPAMDHDMYHHPATQRNLELLRRYGYEILPPEFGELASGLKGDGRLPDPERIAAHVAALLARRHSLAGKHVLVTAGPTREMIDPVRCLTNPSTGTMGFALARAAARRGARVTLVTGPTLLPTPPGVTRIDVTSAQEMYEVVLQHADTADFVFMAAAVADYTPVETAPSKLKKEADELVLRLRRTPDILAELGRRRRPDQVLVGFAMETDNALENAREKLRRKNLDWIALNRLNEPGAGFGTGTNRLTLLHRSGHLEELPLLPKDEAAEALLDRVLREIPSG